jgi:peptide/nickel transport system permease protein
LKAFILRRLFLMLPVTIILSIFVFVITNWLPGDAAIAQMGEEHQLDDRALERLRADMGLDQPAPVRYLLWLADMARGDFGTSTRINQPVSDLILARLPVTIQLGVASMVVTLLIALPFGVISAVRPGSIIDRVVTVFSLSGVAIPNFWLGVLFVLVFSVTLGWLPPSGWVPIYQDPVEAIRYLIMPSIVLGTASAASITRHLRSSLVETLQQPYVTTAYAKGLHSYSVVYAHALRNALIPVVTLLGLQIGNLISGSVIVETIFGLPGIGRTTVDAILSRDLPVLQATVLIIALMVLLANLITDIVYGWLDPRIRYS